MIDPSIIQSSSEFAGFSNLGSQTGQVVIPAGTTIPALGTAHFPFNISRPNSQTLGTAIVQLVGPSQSDTVTHDSNKWKNTAYGIGGATWDQIDGTELSIQVYIKSTSGSFLTMNADYFNSDISPLTYNTGVTINVKVYYYQFLW